MLSPTVHESWDEPADVAVREPPRGGGDESDVEVERVGRVGVPEEHRHCLYVLAPGEVDDRERVAQGVGPRAGEPRLPDERVPPLLERVAVPRVPCLPQKGGVELLSKGGSEVGRGYRNLPTSVFRVVRARSAWGEEPEKVSRPLLAARRRATLRVQGAPGRVSGRRAQACGMESGMGAGASGHGMRSVSDCWGARKGLRRDVAWRTEARFRVAAPLP